MIFKRGCRLLLFILLFFCMRPGKIYAQVYYTESGDAEFTSNAPLHSFKGSSAHLVGKISLPDSTVDFYIDLNTLDTGNRKRDKDMRETLETKKYPFAEFYGMLAVRSDAGRDASQPVTVQGEFKIHNHSRKITVDGMLQKTAAGLQVKAAWILKLTDYDIEPPGILFYRVDEKIEIEINALLKPADL